MSDSLPHEHPVSVGLRIDDANPGHVRASIWVGRIPGQRARAGELVFRSLELLELLTAGLVHDPDRGDTLQLEVDLNLNGHADWLSPAFVRRYGGDS